MPKKFTKQRKVATAAADPQQKLYDRLRARADRALLKRRRRKSHQ